MGATVGVAAALGRTAPPPPSGVLPTGINASRRGAARVSAVRPADGPAAAVRLAFRLPARHRGSRRRRSLSGRSVSPAQTWRRLAARTHLGLDARLPDHPVGHVVRSGSLRRDPVLVAHDRPHDARHDRSDPAGARRPGDARAASAARRRPRQPTRAARGHRRDGARTGREVRDPPVGRLPAVRRVLLRHLFHRIVRRDDRLALRPPADERALPGGGVPLLLGDHRHRPGAAPSAADGQARPAVGRSAVPRVLRPGVDELPHPVRARPTTADWRCPG